MSMVISLGLAIQRPAAAPAAIPPAAPPVNAALPVITGTATEGQTLTTSPGTWTNGPTGFSYQWQRGGMAISGAMAASHIVVPADVSRTLTVTVTATNATGSASATSAATAVVQAAGAPAPFPFILANETGATAFTSVPNLRISLDGGTTWQTLAAAGLTVSVAPEGDALLVDGFTNAATQAPLFHYEQRIEGEPNSTATSTAANLPALYFRRVGGPAPINTTIPGMTVCATRLNSPVGVS